MNAVERIQELKAQRKAVILAHNYQSPEVQDVADYVGDSLGLSQKAASTDAEVIIFCGVDFMAESAKILSPAKKVILPESEAMCPMSAMCTDLELAPVKEKYPGGGHSRLRQHLRGREGARRTSAAPHPTP